MADSGADDGAVATNAAVPFITRVRLKNYKSIASCDVSLGPLTILIGPNGSGKSNFLDALAFLSRALRTTLDEAIDERGGLDNLLCRVPDQAKSFTIAVDAVVPWWPSKPELSATYELEVGPGEDGPVIREEFASRGAEEPERLRREHNRIYFDGPAGPGQIQVGIPSDRLALQMIAFDPFRQFHVGLSAPRFYNFDPKLLRTPQPSAARPVLQSTGEGLGDVLAALAAESPPDSKKRIDSYLGAIVQDAVSVNANRIGGYMAVSLQTLVSGRELEFSSLSMSDGTIRAAAVLAALFQPESFDGRLPLIGIEEPELALHPSAAGVLYDALTEASEHVQVIAASQSADLLDREEVDPSAIRAVIMGDGLTHIGEVDSASQEIAAEKLQTFGEMMRSNQIYPDIPEGGRRET